MWRLALLLLALAGSAGAAEPSRLALVVSDSAYQSLPALPACLTSANVVAASLRRAGWTVTELHDPSNGQLGAGIEAFSERLSKAPGASALVYACSYAVAFEGRLFLLPASARLARDTDALTEGVVLPVLTGSVARAKVAAGFVVADLMSQPGKPAVPAEAAARRGPAARTGLLVATSSPAGTAAGPTPAAVALAKAVSQPDLSVWQAQSIVGEALKSAGLPGFIQPPTEEAWLAGGSAPKPVAASSTPQEAAAPSTSEPARTPATPPSTASPPPPAPGPAAEAQLAPAAPAAPPAPSAPAAPPAPSAPVTQSAPQPEPASSGAIATLNDLDRRRVQLALQHLGYYGGRVDGALGPESLAAIRRYQHELGGEMTGHLTEGQLARLLSTP